MSSSAPRSFDDLLGPPETRYFATGYKRIRYGLHFGEVSIGADRRATCDGLGAVSYPTDWSLAADGLPRQAHLSSVDALVLSVAAIEHAIIEIPGMGDLASVVIDDVSIRSGAHPGTNLSAVPWSVTLMPKERELYAELRVGGFRIHTQLREVEVLGGQVGELRPYWDGYRQNTVTSELIAVDLRERLIITNHIAHEPAHRTAAGIDSAVWPALTHIDNVALFGQIAQVLAQTAAGVARGSIDNLWMRRMAFTRIATFAPTRFQARARIVENSVIERGGNEMHSLQMEAVSEHGVKAEALFGFVLRSR